MRKEELKTKINQAVHDFDYDNARILMGGNSDARIDYFIEILVNEIFDRYTDLMKEKICQ